MENFKGKTFRGYELRELIGVGGFGVVYRAYQAILEREVAIKIILPRFASQPNFIRNFEREAQLVARLEHPHIVPLYDYWREPSGAFIVMRLLRGGSLQESLKRDGFWELEATARLLEQIGGALAEAHRNNVIHQDIKAANILLDEQGNAYLTDFGIAKDLARAKDAAADEPVEPGAKKEVHGSPEYMAPEQILNLPVDARADIYSLGVVTYEVLTGEKPFAAPTDEELVRRQLYEKVPSLRAKRPDIHANFDLVIQKATDKNPKRRYNTALLLAENFRQFLILTQTSTSEMQQVNVTAAPPPPAEVEAPAVEVRPEPINPYKGLNAFQEADAGNFFGREKLVESLYLKMLEPGAVGRFLVVTGPSGSGKSSVVRAGLVPMMRANLRSWFITDMIPGTRPLQQLTDAVMRVTMDTTVDYGALLRDSVTGLHQALLKGLGEERNQMVLLIDQFEELFTLVGDEQERQFFLDSLLFALKADTSRLRVIITLRADFYDRPLMYSGLGELVSARTAAVTPLTTEELIRVIEEPAKRADLELEDNLVSEIIADVTGPMTPLPLLQFALVELYERRVAGSDGQKRKLTTRAYRAIGGVTGALTRKAEEIFTSLTPDEQMVAQQLFLRLITPGEGAEDTRRRVLRTELASMRVDQEQLRTVIDRFGKERLLSFDREAASREPTTEISHEALIRNWKRFKKWLDDNRDALRLQRQLADSALQWQANNEDESFLVTGRNLGTYEVLHNTPSVVLSNIERDYLTASIRLQERNERARQRQVQLLAGGLVFMSLLAVTAVILWVLATQARDQAVAAESTAVAERDRADTASRISRSNELAVVALSGRSPTDRALLLAVEAFKAADTYEARDALFTLIRSVPRLEGYLHGNAEFIRDIVYSPDGQWIATAGRDRTVRLWQAADGTPAEVVLTHLEAVNSVVFSPDSQSVVTAAGDGLVRRWSRSDGVLLWEHRLMPGEQVWQAAISPDGLTVAAVTSGGTLWLLDAATGEPRLEPIIAHTGVAYTVAFRADGLQLATGGEDFLVRLWDSATLEPQQQLTAHRNWVLRVAYSPDGTRLVSGDFDGQLLLWDLTGSEPVGVVLAGHSGEVRGAAFDSTGLQLVSGASDGQIILWDVANGALLATFTSEGKNRVWSVDFSPDGAQIVSGGENPAAQLWSLRRRSLAGQTWSLPPDSRLIDPTTNKPVPPPVGAIAFSLDGEQLVAVGNNQSGADALNSRQGWLVNTGEALEPVEFPENSPYLFTALNVSPDQRLLLGGGQDGTVVLYDLASAAVDSELRAAHPGTVFAVALSADGQQLATADAIGNIRLWQRSLTDPAVPWTLERELTGVHLDRVLALVFSPDGRYLASGSRDSTAVLWTLATGTGVSLSGHTQAVVSVTFTPDSETLISGGRDNLMLVRDVATTRVRQTIQVHLNWVNTMTFSPDGRYLATGSRDETVILWYVQDGTLRPVGEPLTANTPVTGVAFSPDSRWVAFGGESGGVQLWQVATEPWQMIACRIASRDLSQEEWSTYMHGLPYESTCDRME